MEDVGIFLRIFVKSVLVSADFRKFMTGIIFAFLPLTNPPEH
jgi:hypothetical protein